MKILIATEVFDKFDPKSGYFVRWAEEFAKRFEKVTVICIKRGHFVLPPNVNVLSLVNEEGNFKSSYLRMFKYLISEERNNYDVVFVNLSLDFLKAGGKFWKKAGKQVMFWSTHKAVTWKMRFAIKHATFIATGNRDGFDLQNPKVRYLGHGVDTDLFKFADERIQRESTTILTIGRISESKGFETIINAMPLIESPVRLIIVGSPATKSDVQYYTHLKAFIKTLHLEDKIDFHEGVLHDDMPSIMKLADIFVNTSKTGSLDRTALEAMSCGLPTLSSNTAFKTMLEQFGFTFKEGDSKELARIINDIISRKGSLISLSMRIRDVVTTNHSIPRLIAKIQVIFETAGKYL